MRFVMFYHSLISDWNHGNAHFLRGIATELVERGHRVDVYEPRTAWSVQNLVEAHGAAPLEAFQQAYPLIRSTAYDLDALDLDGALDGADVVIVHEWNDPQLVTRVGAARARGGFTLFFHDTHHRAATATGEMQKYDLTHYDGVLAFGAVIRDLYLERGWARAAWTWHEAADTRVFRPLPRDRLDGDLVWIGNWGDDERTRELREYLIEPVRELNLRTVIHGVRYPAEARALLAGGAIEYRGWLPNFDVPRVFSRFRVTVHVPRRPYARALPGIPTIRPFEAMACGIPLISAPWDDAEQLFRPGTDYLVAEDGRAMRRLLRDVLNDDTLAASLALNGRRTILDRHTCAHRVDELLAICSSVTHAQQELMAT